MANSMLTLEEYSITKKLSYTRVVLPSLGGHSVDAFLPFALTSGTQLAKVSKTTLLRLMVLSMVIQNKS